MKIKLVILSFLFCSFAVAQKHKRPIIDSVFIYKEKHRVGTTANSWVTHTELIRTDAPKKKLVGAEFDEFVKTLNTTKSKKLWQQKYGGDLIFLIVYANNKATKYLAGSGTKFYVVDNISEMRRWLIPIENATSLIEVLEKNIDETE